MLTFIVLTLAVGIDERVSTPTTVVIMAIDSVVGAFLHGVVNQDVGIAFEYGWWRFQSLCLERLGAYMASKAHRDHIIWLLLSGWLRSEEREELPSDEFHPSRIWVAAVRR